jgi:hypothetical protein
MYSDLYLKKQIKVPTWVFILVIFTSFFLLSKIFSTSSVPSRAAKTTLKQLQLVNVSSNRLGIFWQTEAKETGWLVLGENENQLTKIVTDDRDLADKKNKFNYHYVLVKDLLPNTKYYYKIVSDTGVFTDKGKAFSFKTPKSIQFPGSAKPAYGKVFLPNNQPAENSFLILTYDGNTYPLLTVAKSSGEWLIPLNGIVSKLNGENKIIQSNDKLKIEIVSDLNYKTTIQAIVANLSPLPQTIILGKDYTFLDNQEVLGANTNNNKKEDTQKIDIIYPKENALIPVKSPLIKGVAFPNKQVNLELIANKKYYFKVQSDQNGLWKVATEIELSAGSAVLTLTTKDEKEKDVKVVRKFSIAKSGEQVLGEATAAATITPTNVPQPTTVAVATAMPTYITTPAPTLKVAGTSYFPLILTSASMVILGLGVMIIF